MVMMCFAVLKSYLRMSDRIRARSSLVGRKFGVMLSFLRRNAMTMARLRNEPMIKGIIAPRTPYWGMRTMERIVERMMPMGVILRRRMMLFVALMSDPLITSRDLMMPNMRK